MNENTLEGGAKAGLGKMEGAAGDALGDPKMQARGGAAQMEGQAQSAAGKVQDAVAQVADQARTAVAQVAGKAKAAYGKASDTAGGVADTVDPFVKERPYAALGLAALAGLFLGLLFAGRGPKVVYVRPRI